jgi:O-antigen ligase
MGYIFLCLATIVQLMQPASFDHDLADLQLYQNLILLACAMSIPRIVAQLAPDNMIARPISIMILGLFFTAILSNIARSSIYDARSGAEDLGKSILYYFLFVGLVTSVPLLRRFWFVLFLAAFSLTVLSLLQFYELIDVPALKPYRSFHLDEAGQEDIMIRMRSVGVYNDPNDFCLLLVMGMLICFYFMGERSLAFFRFLWFVPIVVFGWGMALTQSRGGFLGLAAGLLCLGYERFGRKKTIVLSLLVSPALLIAFAGRMTDISGGVSQDTGRERLEIWGSAMMALKANPIFGVGYGVFRDEVGNGLVAHNSFIHTWTEVGLVGGAMFSGAFFYAVWSLHRLKAHSARIADPELIRLRPFLAALLTGFAVGLFSLSRSYVMPTYMMLGMATSYLDMVSKHDPAAVPRFNLRLVRTLALATIAFLALIYILVRILNKS